MAPDPCPHCLAARAALDDAPGEPGAYLAARGWRESEFHAGVWFDPLDDEAKATTRAVDEQRRRDALVIAGVRAGMERAAEIANELPAHRSAGEAAHTIRAALPADPGLVVVTRARIVEALALILEDEDGRHIAAEHARCILDGRAEVGSRDEAHVWMVGRALGVTP